MIRTTLTPVTTKVHLSVPEKYIGKKVEVLLYTIDEVESDRSTATAEKKTSDYAGSLSSAAANDLLEYVKQGRKEWNRNS